MINLKTKNELKEIFKTGVHRIEFQKMNGKKRTMICTRDPNIIPKEKVTSSEKKHKENDDIFVIWDIENEGWRSFRIDRLLKL